MGVCRKKYSATPDTAARLETFKRTKLCKFDQLGKCKKGKDCNYAHGSSALQPPPDFERTRLCKNFMQTGTCVLGDDCKFAHGEKELRVGEESTVPKGPEGVLFDMGMSANKRCSVPCDPTLDNKTTESNNDLSALIDAVQVRLRRLRVTQQEIYELQKAHEEQSHVQQLLKQPGRLMPQMGLAIPVLHAANAGVVHPIILPTMVKHEVLDTEIQTRAPPSAPYLQTQQGIVNNGSIECKTHELSQGNVESLTRLLMDTTVSQHSNSEHPSRFCDDSIGSLNHVHCNIQQVVGTSSTLPGGSLTLDSLSSVCDRGFSRQTTPAADLCDVANRGFSRQTTAAAEFYDSPYSSDFDTTSEPSDAKAEALRTQLGIVNNGSVECNMQELTQGNVESWTRLVTDTTVSRHFDSEHTSPFCGDTIGSLNRMHCNIQEIAGTSSTLPAGRQTLDSFSSVCDRGFSRQTTPAADFRDVANRGFSRQTTPAVDFCDSPYCSDFDATSEPGDAKTEALEDVEIKSEREGSDDLPETKHPPRRNDEGVVKPHSFRFQAFPGCGGFPHFGSMTVRRVSSADGRLQF